MGQKFVEKISSGSKPTLICAFMLDIVTVQFSAFTLSVDCQEQPLSVEVQFVFLWFFVLHLFFLFSHQHRCKWLTGRVVSKMTRNELIGILNTHTHSLEQSTNGFLLSAIYYLFYFIMKSYTRYTMKIKGKSKILSIQRPDNINFWPVEQWRKVSTKYKNTHKIEIIQ